MHFIRLLDAVGKANKYLIIQTLLCGFVLQLLYICMLEWSHRYVMSLAVYQTPGDQEHAV